MRCLGRRLYGLMLGGGVLVFGFPIFWMVRGSLIDPTMWLHEPLIRLPPLSELSFDSFASLFSSPEYYMGRVLTDTAFEGMMVSLYLVATKMGVADTFAGILLPMAASAFGTILMWRFFTQVPDDIIEVARVDGADWGTILFSIAIPLAAPAVATIAVLHFLAGWEAFVWPMAESAHPLYIFRFPIAFVALGDPACGNTAKRQPLVQADPVQLPRVSPRPPAFDTGVALRPAYHPARFWVGSLLSLFLALAFGGRTLALNKAELIMVYVMLIIVSSVCTMGLSQQLLPLISALFYFVSPSSCAGSGWSGNASPTRSPRWGWP